MVIAGSQVADRPAVCRFAPALRVTPPARCGSESNMAGRFPSSPSNRSGSSSLIPVGAVGWSDVDKNERHFSQ